MTRVYAYGEEINSRNKSLKSPGKRQLADLLIETVGFQALEDHRILHRVRMVSSPLPGNNARRAQAGEQILHQAQDLTWGNKRN